MDADVRSSRRSRRRASERRSTSRSCPRGGPRSTSWFARRSRPAGRDARPGQDIAVEYPIVAHGPQAASVHDPGSGPIRANEAVVVDLGVRDGASGCWADMTRTFCAGEPPAEIVEYHRVCLEVLERVITEIRPGVSGEWLHQLADGMIADAGYPTLLTKESGKPLEDGFFHTLGHGVGLEIHEAPSLGRNGEALVAGDVLAVEPGIYRRGLGGCRLEDLVLVTADRAQGLTQFPYDLQARADAAGRAGSVTFRKGHWCAPLRTGRPEA